MLESAAARAQQQEMIVVVCGASEQGGTCGYSLQEILCDRAFLKALGRLEGEFIQMSFVFERLAVVVAQQQGRIVQDIEIGCGIGAVLSIQRRGNPAPGSRHVE